MTASYEEILQRPEARELKETMENLQKEVVGCRQAEEALKNRKKALEIKVRELEEVNATLKAHFKRRHNDRLELKDRILSKINEFALPHIEKLKKSGLNEAQMSDLELLEENLKDIISPFSPSLVTKLVHLTPMEIRVANLIRRGLNTRQIAEYLFLSPHTIRDYRRVIRMKLDIDKTDTNLTTYLQSIQ